MKTVYKALLAASLLLMFALVANAATLMPNGKQQFFSANGTPLAGGFVYFYIPGTSTPKDTYQDPAATILNTNPIILDAAGEAIVYGIGSYRQVVTDSSSNTIWDQLTADTSGDTTVTRNAYYSGTGTYTPRAGVTRIHVRMLGAGGGGGGAGGSPTDGTSGGDTSFGAWTALGATGGVSSATGASGYGGNGGVDGVGVRGLRSSGGYGGQGSQATMPIGGSGGSTVFGGGAPTTVRAQAGGSAPLLGTGSGGAAYGTVGAGGGGGGEYVDFWVVGPTATTYSVGAAGAGGTGTYAGGAASFGTILIEEFYN